MAASGNRIKKLYTYHKTDFKAFGNSNIVVTHYRLRVCDVVIEPLCVMTLHQTHVIVSWATANTISCQ